MTAIAGPPSFDLSQRPFIVFWEVTRACALSCHHCRAAAQPRRHPGELTTAEGHQLIDDVAEARPAMFVLTGGDPLLRPDLMQFIFFSAFEHGLRTGLSPSATPLLLRTDFRTLKAAGVDRMSLSLDGATAEKHDAFRRVPGTFDRTMQAVQRCHDAGLPVQINTTLHRDNIGDVDAFAELMLKIHPALWSVFLIVPTGRATVDDLPDAAAVEGAFVRLHEIASTAPFEVKTTEGHHYRRIVLQKEHSASRLTKRAPLGIRDGCGVMFISHTGDISPSGFLPVVAGNCRHDKVASVYRHHQLFRNLRDHDRLGGKCGRCEYRTVCGGSRSRALAVHGDVFAEEPLCSYQPATRGPRAEADLFLKLT